jgi:hypothetical protein
MSGFNPMVLSIIATIIRYLLAGAFTTLVAKGVITADQSEYIITGLVGFVAVVGWALWVRYRDRVKITTGLALPQGTTEDEMTRRMSRGQSAPATLATDKSPYLPPPTR